MIRSGRSIGRPRIIAFTIVNIVPFMPIPSAKAITAGKCEPTVFQQQPSGKSKVLRRCRPPTSFHAHRGNSP